MKNKITYLFTILVILLQGCQTDDDPASASVGYLRLDIGTNSAGNTKASEEEETYNAKRLLVKILKADGSQACEPFEYDATAAIPEKKVIELPVGTYTVQASSAGFDGETSAYDKPYYSGRTENIKVEKNQEVAAKVTCTLANVKVTVKFDPSFKEAFQSATATVSSLEEGDAAQLIFKMGDAQNVGYFPVVDLKTQIAIVNKAGTAHDQTNEIKGVKARDHYILNYKIAESGEGSIKISVDDATRTYTYDFTVPTKASLMVTANAWSNFAYLEGTMPESGTTIDPSKIEFLYKLASEDDESWKKVEGDITTSSNGTYLITLKGLTPNTAYQCKIAYDNKSSVSSAVNFTTEDNTIPTYFNLSFDDWYKDGKNLYACSESNYASQKFWDSGNKGANTLKEINPTRPEESDKIKGKAALLASTKAAGQFAAGSLYTGSFGSATISPLGAKLNFGRAYNIGRPSKLKGFYKYNPGKITHTKKDFIKEGDRDSCSIYIALTTWNEPFDVSTGDNRFVDFNDESIIAYGELTKDEMSPESMADYKEFSINLKYRDLYKKPTYILIVCSSSKYGDYFTGSTDSKLLIDEFDLEFGEPTIDENYIQDR